MAGILSQPQCVNGFRPWTISSKSLGNEFAIKKAKISFVCFIIAAVWDAFFPNLTKMVTGMKSCVVCYDFWPWHIYSRSFCDEFAIKTAKILHIMSCPLSNIISSGRILSIFDTNDLSHKRVCCVQWLFPLTYIFKVILVWLWNRSC